MWIYSESTGKLTHNGAVVSCGYSGLDKGKNNPAMQAAVGIGPIPQGRWNICYVKDSPNTGPFTIVLMPCPGTKTFNRSEFRIHGDSVTNPGSASHGCIILPRIAREEIWQSLDRDLTVVN